MGASDRGVDACVFKNDCANELDDFVVVSSKLLPMRLIIEIPSALVCISWNKRLLEILGLNVPITERAIESTAMHLTSFWTSNESVIANATGNDVPTFAHAHSPRTANLQISVLFWR